MESPISSPAAFLPRPRILSRSPIGFALSSLTRSKVPVWPTKNAKAGEPEGSSALARGAYGGLGHLVKGMHPRKNTHVATFRGRSASVGTLARARGEKSPHSTSAQAGPGTAEARNAQGRRRPDAAAAVLRGDRRRGGRRHRRDRHRRDPRPGQRPWREQIELRGGRREVQPPPGDPEDEGSVAAGVPVPGRPPAGAGPDHSPAGGRQHPLPLSPRHLRRREEGGGPGADRDQRRGAVPDPAEYARQARRHTPSVDDG